MNTQHDKYCAYHEAGHAVVGLRLGLGVSKVELFSHGREVDGVHACGQTTAVTRERRPARAFLVDPRTRTHRVREPWEHAHVRDLLIFYLAGYEASRLHGQMPKNFKVDGGASEDVNSAMQVLAEHGVEVERAKQIVRALRGRARKLVLDLILDIDEFADLLLRKRALSTEDIDHWYQSRSWRRSTRHRVKTT
jgi:hypothetical protein